MYIFWQRKAVMIYCLVYQPYKDIHIKNDCKVLPQNMNSAYPSVGRVTGEDADPTLV